MQRRDLLRTGTALAAASTFGLAGCLGGGCGTPDGDLEDALPEGDDYEQMGDPSEGSSESDAEQAISAIYSEGDGENSYVFVIAEFESSDAAESASDEFTEDSSDSSDSEGAAGYIVADAYIYTGAGPSEDDVIAFMETSPPLGDCVEDNIEFV